jgi:RecA-family ATPase
VDGGTGLTAPVRFNAAWLMGQSFPPIEYAVPGLIPEGLSLLVAAPKVGKSWLVLDIALAVASGRSVLGAIHTGRPRAVLYLALEDGPRRLQDRLKVLGVTDGPHMLDFQVTAEDAVGAIRNWLEDHRDAPVVILDTLGKVMPTASAGESDYQRDYRVGGVLKSLVDAVPGAALIVVHHTRKAESSDFLDTVSGTQGLAGAADSILVIRRPRAETTGSLSVTSRDAAEGEYQIVLTDGRWALDGSDLSTAAAALRDAKAAENLGERSAEILAYVVGRPDGVSPAEIATVVGIDSDTAGRYLRRLAESGRIAKSGRGRYTRRPARVRCTRPAP